jgi:UDP-N-acetylmuramyl pentapeptide phosphotransferase/UDP-N-acetylglucosamine-1-phosphate transferase
MSLHIPVSAYTAFGVSLLIAILLVLTKNMHGRYSMDETIGIQKAHKNPTPRIGGIAIVAGVIGAWAMAKPERQAILGPLLLAGLPAFVFGLAEDLTKQVSVMARLLATMASGVLGWWITGVSLTSVDVPLLDPLLGIGLVSVLFTAFAIGGVANAINIIDGFNGLASGFVLLALVGIAGLAYSEQDLSLALACLAVAAAVFGFWLVNWPWGKIFLGDGGSYFGGFALAWACVMLIERNPGITAFAPLLVCIHPVTEVLFSIYRRKLRQTHPGHPDRLHLHSLIMRRLVRTRWGVSRHMTNPITGLLLALMSVPAVLAAYAFHSQTALAAIASVLFMLGYVTLYARLVRFRWCSPIAFLLVKPAQVLRVSHRT